jgi:hypothetical protein
LVQDFAQSCEGFINPLTREIPSTSISLVGLPVKTKVPVFVLLGRDKPTRPAFTSFPSSFDYDVTRATAFAPGIEQGDTARFPQC